jgi:putative peptidoglycan lipid II flippase
MGNVKKFWYYISNKKLTIANAAFILGVTGLLSNILGLYRERMVAGKFGAGDMTDAFYASFTLPDIIFTLLVLGAVSSAFIPVFVEKLSAGKSKEANELASSFLNLLLIFSALFGVVIFILAPQLVPFLFPGFFNRPEASFDMYQTTVNMTRLLILSPIFFAVSAVFGGILNSHKRFIAYSLAPLIYNLSIIFGIVFLTPYFDPPIYGVAVGVVIGAFLHAFIQLAPVLATGYRWKSILDFRNGDIPRLIKLMIPRSLAIGTSQINLLVDTLVATFFVGGITVLRFANNIQTAPTVIFGIAIATAIFPVLSEARSKGDMADFMKNFSWSARRILFFMIPVTIGIIVLRAQIVRLIYGTGNFTWDDTYWTTKALLFFAIGLVAQGLIPLLLKAFYSIQDTKSPFYIAVIVMVINIVLSVSLPFIPALELGVAGIALAFSIAGIVNAILLFAALHDKIGALDPDHKIFESTTRLIAASMAMGLAVHYSLYFFDIFFDNSYTMGLLLQTTAATLTGIAVYLFITWRLKCEETTFFINKFHGKVALKDNESA